ncbi:MAG: M3 family oligoendopeptidase [Anaerolineae bacterium]|nr:M3 family oligoendopeptidase [Anaerolineae bacterium]
MSTPLPRWDLSNVYPGLESPEFTADVQRLVAQLDDLSALFDGRVAAASAAGSLPELADVVGELVGRFNRAMELADTLQSYVYGFTSTDSRDQVARRRLSELQMVGVRLQTLFTRFRAWIGKLGPTLEEVIALSPIAAAHAFPLREMAEQSKYLMSEAEEALAAELSVSGAQAWSKLQHTLISQLTVDFAVNGRSERMPLPALINLRSHPDADVRRRAYEAELQVLDSVREPLAACLNGVKGATITLERRRGRQDPLDKALDQARIDRASLDAMLSAIEAALPTFRRYLLAKAQRLGKERLAWWDLFAPIGQRDRTYTFDEAADFILENFATFSPELAEMAQRAFQQRWIDAEPREGKAAGAFCMGVDAVRESRILCNFDGSMDQVFTLAHELGHAFHNHCLYAAGKTPLQSQTPMTLAETASIMCETIVTEAALAQAASRHEELAILESALIGQTQVIVDIYSRFLFEREVFRRRAQAELSADDFDALMLEAQRAAYGEALDEAQLHRAMWTWKPHYYYANLSFYNFPYAFGLLFGTGLYAIYRQRGAAFVPDYMALLASTGEATAADLAARFGIDVRSRRFWEDSLAVIGRRIERYCAL